MQSILISCGHLWKDSGAISEGIREVDINWVQTIACLSYLNTIPFSDSYEFSFLVPEGFEQDLKYGAYLDNYKLYEHSRIPRMLTITDRVNAANRSNSILIELHNNIFSDPEVGGSEAIIFSKKNKYREDSEANKLSVSILNKLSSVERSRGVKELYSRDQRNYVVPRERRPAILYKTLNTAVIVETGFISNLQYRKRINNFAYNTFIGTLIGQGIVNYIKNYNVQIA